MVGRWADDGAVPTKDWEGFAAIKSGFAFPTEESPFIAGGTVTEMTDPIHPVFIGVYLDDTTLFFTVNCCRVRHPDDRLRFTFLALFTGGTSFGAWRAFPTEESPFITGGTVTEMADPDRPVFIGAHLAGAPPVPHSKLLPDSASR